MSMQMERSAGLTGLETRGGKPVKKGWLQNLSRVSYQWFTTAQYVSGTRFAVNRQRPRAGGWLTEPAGKYTFGAHSYRVANR